jgi:hypothetical protein
MGGEMFTSGVLAGLSGLMILVFYCGMWVNGF